VSASSGTTGTRARGKPTTTRRGRLPRSAPRGCSAKLCLDPTHARQGENLRGLSYSEDLGRRPWKRSRPSSSSTSGQRFIGEPVVDVVSPGGNTVGLSRSVDWERIYMGRLTYDLDSPTRPSNPVFGGVRRSASGKGWHAFSYTYRRTARSAWTSRLLNGDDPVRVAMDILRYAHYPEKHRPACVFGMLYRRKRLKNGRMGSVGAWENP
jgi:hypothetical protein